MTPRQKRARRRLIVLAIAAGMVVGICLQIPLIQAAVSSYLDSPPDFLMSRRWRHRYGSAALAIAMLQFWGFRALWRRYDPDDWRRSGYCPQCGFDLSYRDWIDCPECGRPVIRRPGCSGGEDGDGSA